MKAFLYHVQLNVGAAGRSVPFYRALFDYLEYRVVARTAEALRPLWRERSQPEA